MGFLFTSFATSLGGPIFLIFGLVAIFITFNTVNVDPFLMFMMLALFGPIWIPLTLFLITFDRWMDFVNLRFEDINGRVTLRIRLPQEVTKSPQAMEEVLQQLANPNRPKSLIEAYWLGKIPLVHSFELVSIGGDVRFYINLPLKKAKNLVESQLYAQYPGIEITEEPIDYTAEIKWDPKKWEIMSFHYTKSKDRVLPIKTYIDWGLDKLPKEEEKVEPIAPVLEYLGSIKPYERLWIQIIASPHTRKEFQYGSLRTKPDWTKEAGKKVDELMGRDRNKLAPAEFEMQPRLTQSERDSVTAIERNASKAAYDVGIRIIYAAPPDKFSGDVVTATIRAMATYEVVGRNKIAMGWRTDYDYKLFQDPFGTKRVYYKKKELDYYKIRFYKPFELREYKDGKTTMSVEELATLWHIPGQVILTPGLARVESLRRDAPANLPTGNEATRLWN
jgi:hypothetical protein